MDAAGAAATMAQPIVVKEVLSVRRMCACA